MREQRRRPRWYIGRRRDYPTWRGPAWVTVAVVVGLLACGAYARLTGQGW